MTNSGKGEVDDCIFCSAVSSKSYSSLVVHRGDRCFIILNKFPYNNGHLMVVPMRHVGTLSDIGEDELSELTHFIQKAEVVLTEAYKPHGINVGINLGRSAGAGIVDHLHVHVIPRWEGDTNFMTAVAGTRVIPEEFEDTLKRLQPIFKRLT